MSRSPQGHNQRHERGTMSDVRFSDSVPSGSCIPRSLGEGGGTREGNEGQDGRERDGGQRSRWGVPQLASWRSHVADTASSIQIFKRSHLTHLHLHLRLPPSELVLRPSPSFILSSVLHPLPSRNFHPRYPSSSTSISVLRDAISCPTHLYLCLLLQTVTSLACGAGLVLNERQ